MSPNPLKEKWGKKIAFRPLINSVQSVNHIFPLIHRQMSIFRSLPCLLSCFKLNSCQVNVNIHLGVFSTLQSIRCASAPYIKVGLAIKGVKGMIWVAVQGLLPLNIPPISEVYCRHCDSDYTCMSLKSFFSLCLLCHYPAFRLNLSDFYRLLNSHTSFCVFSARGLGEPCKDLSGTICQSLFRLNFEVKQSRQVSQQPARGDQHFSGFTVMPAHS